MESTSTSSPAAAGELQFDRAELGETAPGGTLECIAGGEAITDAYYEINGEVVCEACQAKALAMRTGGSSLGRFVRATVFGTLAGATGAGIYYGISALTGGWEFGLIAILVGFMVGFAVNLGSRQRGGWFYQLLAVGLTYCSIVSTYIPPIAEELRQMPMEEMAAEGDVAGAPANSEPVVVSEEGYGEPEGLFAEEAEPPDVPEPVPAETAPAVPADGGADAVEVPAPAAPEDEIQALISGVFFWIFVVVIAFLAPVLAGFENILGILIIGFGLWQAWQLNRKRPFEVSGPFQVAAAGG